VGDAEFQKKAIGKMQNISREGGRTVLFVSHNMAAVRSLCTRGIVLENGKIKFDGKTEDALDIYQKENNLNVDTEYFGEGLIKHVILYSLNQKIKYKDALKLDVYIETQELIKNLVLGIIIKDLNDVELVGINNRHYLFDKINQSDVYNGKITVIIEELNLLPGIYKIDLFLGDSINDREIIKEVITFVVDEAFEYEIVNRLNFKINKVFHENVKWEFAHL
jgi:lipopolysaccharide transport system ATP-binding protein